MPPASTSAVIRDILKTDQAMPSDQVIRLARARGVTGEKRLLQKRIVSVRSELKQSGSPSPTTAAPKPATPTPAASSAKPAASKPSPTKPTTPSDKLGMVLSNVALVNAVVSACGGVENARSAAEAVRACGGVDPFIKHLDLIADIRPKGK